MISSVRRGRGAALAAGLVAAAAAVVWPASAAAAPPACTTNVGGTGLSAAVVAQSGQTIAGRTISTACDIGIFVGPGTSHVTINRVTVTGAGYQAILAENASHIAIVNSVLKGNGFRTINAKAPALPGNGLHSYVGQAFAISLFGVTGGTVRGNTVTDNGRGGIGVMDNGANNPGALTQDKSAKLMGGNGVAVLDNTLSANYNGCAIVVATQNLGGQLSDMWVTGNTIKGTGMNKAKGPDVGGIVVAADLPGSSVRNVLVSNNTVVGSFEAGVIVNAEAPGSSTSAVTVTDNMLSGNNSGKQEAPATAGVVVFAAPGAMPAKGSAPAMPAARNSATTVAGNTISDQFYGIWTSGPDRPNQFANQIRVLPKGVIFSRN